MADHLSGMRHTFVIGHRADELTGVLGRFMEVVEKKAVNGYM